MAVLPVLVGFYRVRAHYLQKEKEANKISLHPRKPLAEVHGNRTHLPPSADGTPDLKSGGPTSEPRTSASYINTLYF